MDPSALIFVGLAVAWAVYLIPKALEHHEEGARTRTVDRFSDRLRVLARREPVNRRKARLVRAGATAPAAATKPVRSAAARAARRRLRVVLLVLAGNVTVGALAWFGVVAPVWCAVPAGALVAWLVACRLMVKRERRTAPRSRIPAERRSEPVPDDATGHVEPVEDAPEPGTDADQDDTRDPDAWDPVHTPLPTYVSKPVARRTVSTIDLDSTGVWSSGHSASDSELAREAEAARSGDAEQASTRRASGA